MKKGFTLLELVIIIGVICILAFMAVPRLSDVRESRMAAQMQKELVNMRIALDEYYKQSGEYPVLKGAEDDLESVTSSDGSVNFGKILGRKVLYRTPEVDGIESSNKVYDINEFDKGTERGGWNYDQSGNTGEVHVNLPRNIFKQEIDWSRQ